MKNLLFILSVVVLFSCDSGGDPAPAGPSKFEGKWYIKSTDLQLNVQDKPLKDYLVGIGYTSNDAQRQVDIIKDAQGAQNLYKTLDFITDGTVAITTKSGSSTNKWSITADQTELTFTSDANDEVKAQVVDVNDSIFQIKMILPSQTKFGASVDYSVVVKGQRKEIKEDPTQVEADPSEIVGSWLVESSQTEIMVGNLTYEEYLVSLGLDAETAHEFAQEIADALTLTNLSGELQFNADHTWTSTGETPEESESGTWTLSDDQKSITITNDAAEDQTQTLTIAKLNDTDLWFQLKLDGSATEGAPPGTYFISTVKLVRAK